MINLILHHIIIPNAYSMSFSQPELPWKPELSEHLLTKHTLMQNLRGGGEVWDTGRKEVKHPEIKLRATWELWGDGCETERERLKERKECLTNGVSKGGEVGE